MTCNNFIKAAIASFAISVVAVPSIGHAETLRVMRGAASSALNVPMNRAVVVESDTPFAELSIANPGIADISSLSDRTIYVLGKEPGRTTLTLLGADGRLITNVEVHVTPDIAEFKERLEQILPGENIEVRTANTGIVLSGTVSSISRLDRALELAERYAPDRVSNLMSVGGTQQVMLKVRFAEMQRSVSKSLSSSIALQGSTLGDKLGLAGITNSLSSSDVANTTVPSGGDNNGAFLFGFNAGGVEVGILLEALEARGVVRTLAEPNLTALSGQEAKFLAGGEYPIPVSQDNGSITIEYKPFGVELNFTPRVIDNDVINLELSAAVSSIDSANGFTANGFSVDAFKRRETSTTVEMRDGESFAIAGLLQDDFMDLNGQVPWVGDIPILGSLFRSAEYSRKQTELVIIVTPHLVTPTRGEVLALPTDRVQPPSERDLFLFGRITADKAPQTGGAGEVARQDFSGSYGYVLDQ
ncbi:MAG: type II and III secretion system protein family protein [Loktanella sp.]|jgi:pilus assembly protein CpaC|nr:type II and III secretion system protein family protein [Yoonia sp.]MDO7556926.1 type II and III secretion system protein family protein [Loktanella sp.]MDO7609048.1 type II and III secretion system protein family protein [Loktanella sp.]MDO7622603.1 type II and III secretion system protein family protein [Loktanella sp.]MDO7626202.1 type II and III secretion system protein family protein [Loktanella sp.]